MNEKYQEIKNLILKGINPEKIYLLDLGPILLLTVVWNSTEDDFTKRIQIRKLLRNINIAFDIIVISTEELEKLKAEKTSFTYDTILKSILIYNKIH